jgi:antibiotic biosynthesis monooxygenase
VLVVMRFAVPVEGTDAFLARARPALAVLAGCPGYVSGELGRAYDDPQCWCLTLVWRSVGAYRRALSSAEVKLTATPLLAQAADQPSAFEPLVTAAPGGEVIELASDASPIPTRR